MIREQAALFCGLSMASLKDAADGFCFPDSIRDRDDTDTDSAPRISTHSSRDFPCAIRMARICEPIAI